MTERTAGPVLLPSELGLAVLSAIVAENPGTEVLDRGAYLRVTSPERCRVSRLGIETALGRPVALPADLELVMPAFRGRLCVDAESVVWEATS
jgi:toluene monooxygenase system protein D